MTSFCAHTPSHAGLTGLHPELTSGLQHLSPLTSSTDYMPGPRWVPLVQRHQTLSGPRTQLCPR